MSSHSQHWYDSRLINFPQPLHLFGFFASGFFTTFKVVIFAVSVFIIASIVKIKPLSNSHCSVTSTQPLTAKLFTPLATAAFFAVVGYLHLNCGSYTPMVLAF